MSIFGEFTTGFCVAPRKPERTAAPIDSGRKLPVEEVVARVGDHRCPGNHFQNQVARLLKRIASFGPA
jgi:hypothetical protein